MRSGVSVVMEYIRAFLVGGLICMLVQILMDKTKMMPGRIMVLLVVMYGILYYIQKEFPNVRGGFIHVPYAVSQVVNKPATPSMAIADITAALEAAVKAAVEYEQDIKVVGGETH